MDMKSVCKRMGAQAAKNRGRVGITAVGWLNGTAAVEEYYSVRGIKWVSRTRLRLSTSIRKAISHVWVRKPVRA